MRYCVLFGSPPGVGAGRTSEDPEIRGLTADSRLVQPGFLFAALPGSKTDGALFVADAIAKGAAVVLTDRAMAMPADWPGIVSCVENPRRRLAQLAARFYGAQPQTVVAVTGTNGKSSTVAFARQLWAARGMEAASLGTLGVERVGGLVSGSMTTPDPVALQASLAALAQDGVTHLAMEASSHGLDQFRLDGVRLSAAAFTNLTQDHLDYHGDMNRYLAAKTRLFTELLPKGAPAIVNVDTDAGQAVAASAQAAGREVMGYGHAADSIKLLSREIRPDGQILTIELFGQRRRVRLPLVGAFQAMNALAALGLVIAAGADAADTAASLEHLQGVRGRMERVADTPNGAAIYVDYAHTPDGLEKVLEALRPHTTGQLVCVFGAGGDRDPTKRPLMGAVVARLADRAIVTDDNPRTEASAAIRQAVLAGCPGAIEIGDRATAIARTIGELQPGDVLVIAGKGHEQGQIVGTTILPFDDATAARQAVADMGGDA